jgi:hypothetical protein
LGLALLLMVYLFAIRPWHLRWGATDEEVRQQMPGDSLIRNATLNTTRAITIQAPPERIWPWLIQMGPGRAGWYSYDRIDNGGEASANRIVPELQVPLQPGQKLTGREDEHPFRVMLVQENQYLVLGPQVSWAFALYPQADGSTRLVERLRAHYDWRSPRGVVMMVLLDVGDFVMMRKQLLNLKSHVENTTGSGGYPGRQSFPQRLTWMRRAIPRDNVVQPFG